MTAVIRTRRLSNRYGSTLALDKLDLDMQPGEQAGADCLPTALLFLGLGALVFSLAPRASTGINYGLVVLAFIWQLFGGALDAPHWLLELSGFQRVGLVPAQAFRAGTAGVMLAIAAAVTIAAVAIFRRRDLVGT
jgi:ABC-2 type transport system permease protein